MCQPEQKYQIRVTTQNLDWYRQVKTADNGISYVDFTAIEKSGGTAKKCIHVSDVLPHEGNAL